MNKRLKITLAVILTILMTVACATVAVFANADEEKASEDYVCRIGLEGLGTYYKSLDAAYDAVQTDETITLIANVDSWSKTITKTFTLKSNNESEISNLALKIGGDRKNPSTSGNLTVAGNIKLYASGVMFEALTGSLTIKDEVYAEAKDTTNYLVDSWDDGSKIVINIEGGTLVGTSKDVGKGVIGLFPANGSELNISGGTITQKKSGSWAVKVPTGGNRTVNISGGHLWSEWGTLSLYGNNEDKPGVITKVYISGDAVIEADDDSAVMFYDYARNTELNISGEAKITAPTKSLYIWSKNQSGTEAGRTTRNCVINIDGGTVEATGSYAIYMRQSKNNDFNISGGTITAKDQTVYFDGITDGLTDFKMSGGTIKSLNGDYALQNNGSTNLNIEISGGTVHAKGTALHTNTGNNLVITGNAVIESETKWVMAWKGGSTGSNIEISGNALLTTPAEKAIEVCSGDTFTVSGGTVESETGKVFYVSGQKNFTINVEGGLVTSPKHTIYTEKASTGAINISGGTVEATNGNKAIYLAHSANNMVTLDITGGTVSADITTAYTEYDSETMDGQHAIFVDNDNSSEVTISGGRVCAIYDAIDIRCVCNVTISGDAYIAVTEMYATNLTNVNLTMTGGTVSAPKNTIAFLGGENTFNMSGGSLIATDNMVLTRTAEGAIVNVNISDDAEIYSAGKALKTQSGITLNITGGLIDVANTYKLAEEADVYMIEAGSGVLNITGGKFVLGGSFGSAQFIAHASSNTDGKSTVDGGLFVNLNTANTTLFGTNVNFISGRAIYGENVIAIVNKHQSASKNLQVYYGNGNDLYYFFTKLAATDADKAGVMEEGASIRLVEGSTGIRFTTTFNAVEGATYGTFILPARYLANITSLNLADLKAYGVDVPAVNGIEEKDGKVTIRCALTEIDPENYGVAFAAVAYVKIGENYYFTEFNMFDNARSIDAVAKAALEDLTDEKDEKHTYVVNTPEGTVAYSPYSSTQRTTLESFIIASYSLARPTGSTLMNTGNGTYSLYAADVDANEYSAYKTSIEGLGFTQPSAM